MSRPAACSWQVLEPGDAQGNWVRKNQHLAEDFPATSCGGKLVEDAVGSMKHRG